MMQCRVIFEERKREIELYFELLTDIIDREAVLIFPLPRDANADEARTERLIGKELSHTLKANGFLLLYNLVEASMTAGFEDIHTQIEAEEGLGADDLVDCLAHRAMRRFKSGVLEDASYFKHPASASILKYWLDDHKKLLRQEKSPLFSGNLDARKIREIGEEYGFSTVAGVQSDGRHLLAVKQKRNLLAHGTLGFRDCGREVSLPELLEIRRDVVAHLDGVVGNIEAYLSNRAYRRS